MTKEEYQRELDELAKHQDAREAWMDSVPVDSPYAPCPCNCGMKWRFVIKENRIEEHEQRFVERWENERDEQNNYAT